MCCEMTDVVVLPKKRLELRQILRRAIEDEDDADNRSRCRDVILSVVHNHKTGRKREPGRCPGHQILHTALYLSFEYSLEDSDVVSALLAEVYHCEKTFERVFAGAIFGIGASYLITGRKSEFQCAADNRSAAEYFLHHATKSRVTFDGRRLGEVILKNVGLPPLEASLQVENADMALLLMKFGVGVGCCRRASPPKLLFLCKIRIWCVLHSNWELPFGLRKLPLPPSLISYMETVDFDYASDLS